MGWRSNWFKPEKEPKPEKRGPYVIFKDTFMRPQRWEALKQNRALLEDAAQKLRTSDDGYCLQAASLVDAAIEVIDDGMANLCRKKPRKRPNDKDED